MEELVAAIRAALDEDERLATAALSHPVEYSRSAHDYVVVGVDDGVWSVDESNAHVVTGAGIHIYDEGGHDEDQAAHIARHDPARVLRQVAAHRKILELHAATSWGVPCCVTCASVDEGNGLTGDPWPCPTLLALAESYGIEVSSDVR